MKDLKVICCSNKPHCSKRWSCYTIRYLSEPLITQKLIGRDTFYRVWGENLCLRILNLHYDTDTSTFGQSPSHLFILKTVQTKPKRIGVNVVNVRIVLTSPKFIRWRETD